MTLHSPRQGGTQSFFWRKIVKGSSATISLSDILEVSQLSVMKTISWRLTKRRWCSSRILLAKELQSKRKHLKTLCLASHSLSLMWRITRNVSWRGQTRIHIIKTKGANRNDLASVQDDLILVILSLIHLFRLFPRLMFVSSFAISHTSLDKNNT